MSANDDFLLRMRDAARAAEHIWPEYAACEIAVESGWDRSGLIREDNNAFGQKAPVKLPEGQLTVVRPTVEVINGQEVPRHAVWLKFGTLAECFAARMALLRRLPIYRDALRARSGRDFVIEVSGLFEQVSPEWESTHANPVVVMDSIYWRFVHGRWSTDPRRAQKILQTYAAHREVLNGPSIPPKALA